MHHSDDSFDSPEFDSILSKLENEIRLNQIQQLIETVSNPSILDEKTLKGTLESNFDLLKDPSFWSQLKTSIIDQHGFELSNQTLEIEKKNKLIMDSIEYAKTIQEAILTSHEYMSSVFPDHFVMYKPKDVVSGDFYWVFKTKSNKLFWATADCTGHGVPGAFMTMIGNSLLNEIIIENEVEETNLILDKLRDSIVKTLNKKMTPEKAEKVHNGMDIALCCWDLNDQTLSFSGAHNPVIIIRNDEVVELKGDKQPIGIHKSENDFTVTRIDLFQGDKIYTFSDGYADQIGGDRDLRFMKSAFIDKLQEISSKPFLHQKDILEETYTSWKGQHEQMDDVVVLGVLVN
jgi:serine phosphatase RsbU (regulator of sigma subunit)